MRHRKLIALALILLGAACLIGAGQIERNRLALPAGFATERVISRIDQPTDFAFLPAGGMIVSERGNGNGADGLSHFLYVEDGEVIHTVLTVSTNVEWNSGLLAFVLDPNFAQNGYFYGWYGSGRLASGWNGQSEMTLSRWTFNFATHKADAASELVMLEVDNWAREHHGNSLVFDNSGYLLIGVGDLTDRDAAQDLGRYEGKVLRIKPTATGYSVPPSNPFVETAGALPEIYAFGFRNPYAMAVRKHDNTLAVGDVGEATWEEVNNVLAGRNYGWPIREGDCAIGEYKPCARTTLYEEAVIDWPHNLDPNAPRGAVTGVAFYEGSEFPDAYDLRLFFTDLTYSFMRTGEPWLSGGDIGSFSEGIEGVVRLRYHNERLYYIDYFSGFINSIYYTGSSNVVPTAEIRVDDSFVVPPQAVGFEAVVEDEDDTVFEYRWDFGDGSGNVSTGSPEVSHTYTVDGTYEAALIVVDAQGAQSNLATVEVTVYSGELPVIELTNLEGNRGEFFAGDVIEYAVSRSNNAGLAPDPYKWKINLWHNTHTHTALSDVVTDSGSFVIPTSEHDNDWNLYYEFELTMETNAGQEIVVKRSLFPQLRTHQYESSHGSVLISVNDSVSQSAFSLQSVVGIENQLIAPDSAVYNQGIYSFKQWSWLGGLGLSQAVVVPAPDQDTIFTAVYEYESSAELIFIPITGATFSQP